MTSGAFLAALFRQNRLPALPTRHPKDCIEAFRLDLRECQQNDLLACQREQVVRQQLEMQQHQIDPHVEQARIIANGIARGEERPVGRSEAIVAVKEAANRLDSYIQRKMVTLQVAVEEYSLPIDKNRYGQLDSQMKIGGEGGDRTHGPVARTAVFETARFGHSRTSPHDRTHPTQGKGKSIIAMIDCGGSLPWGV